LAITAKDISYPITKLAVKTTLFLTHFDQKFRCKLAYFSNSADQNKTLNFWGLDASELIIWQHSLMIGFISQDNGLAALSSTWIVGVRDELFIIWTLLTLILIVS